jgi:hypothetical protein
MGLKVFLGIAVAVVVAVVIVAIGLGHLSLRAPGSAARLYAKHFRARRRERLFLSSLSFFLTFFLVRAITYAIRSGIGPFHNIATGGVHVHHLVWGILLLLAVGYAWLAQVGIGVGDVSVWASRITALLYGIAAALTLDEFALWLRLKDVYWSREGRESVDAVLIFGGLLSVGVWGAPFFHALLRESARLLRR